jgi:hypothetical protein
MGLIPLEIFLRVLGGRENVLSNDSWANMAYSTILHCIESNKCRVDFWKWKEKWSKFTLFFYYTCEQTLEIYSCQHRSLPHAPMCSSTRAAPARWHSATESTATVGWRVHVPLAHGQLLTFSTASRFCLRQDHVSYAMYNVHVALAWTDSSTFYSGVYVVNFIRLYLMTSLPRRHRVFIPQLNSIYITNTSLLLLRKYAEAVSAVNATCALRASSHHPYFCTPFHLGIQRGT